MRFINPDLSIPVNYFVQLEATDEELKELMCYVGFLVTEHVYEKVQADDRFSPSPVWKWWASGTFVGFSGNLIILKGGHRFMDSYEPIAYLVTNTRSHSFLKYFKTCYAKIRQVMGAGSLNNHLVKFTDIYSEFRRTKQHELLLSKHGFAYLRMLELYNLFEADSNLTMVMEVGGGSCVNAALMIGAFGCKYTIIDLPETISFGFAFLKTIFPELRVALPSVIHEHIVAGKEFKSLYENFDLVFMLPYQTDFINDGVMDAAFNVSSFQEMSMGVVNEYIHLFSRALKPSGSLILQNLKVSREVKGNSFENYQLNDFAEVKMCEPAY